MTRPPLVMPKQPTLVDQSGRTIKLPPIPTLEPPPGWVRNPNDDNEAVRTLNALVVSVKVALLPPQPPSQVPSPIAMATVMNVAEETAAAHYFKSPAEAFRFFDIMFSAMGYVPAPINPE